MSELIAPKREFSSKANIRSMDEYRALYQQSIEDPISFWREQAIQRLTFFHEPQTILDADME